VERRPEASWSRRNAEEICLITALWYLRLVFLCLFIDFMYHWFLYVTGYGFLYYCVTTGRHEGP
jgi:hypothetical protein